MKNGYIICQNLISKTLPKSLDLGLGGFLDSKGDLRGSIFHCLKMFEAHALKKNVTHPLAFFSISFPVCGVVFFLWKKSMPKHLCLWKSLLMSLLFRYDRSGTHRFQLLRSKHGKPTFVVIRSAIFASGFPQVLHDEKSCIYIYKSYDSYNSYIRNSTRFPSLKCPQREAVV